MKAKKKVLVVGDIHGDFGALNKLINRKQPDVILQVGDFGWWPHFHNKTGLINNKERFNQFSIKNKLNNGKNCKVYWIPGNHENWNDLKCITDYTPLEIQDDVTYCPFGTVIEINGYNILCCGGAESTDKQLRIENYTWWRDEIISQEDMDNLPDCKIDIVFSHTIPRSFFKYMPVKEKRISDPSTMALQLIIEKYKPTKLFSGHFHKYVAKKDIYIDTELNKCSWKSLDMCNHSSTWWCEL